MSELADHLYCAKQHVFDCCYTNHLREEINPLMKYYVMSLEQVLWCVASFINPADSGDSFISLTERLSKLEDKTGGDDNENTQ